jgi:hypothetical protein
MRRPNAGQTWRYQHGWEEGVLTSVGGRCVDHHRVGSGGDRIGRNTGVRDALSDMRVELRRK